MQKKLKLLCIVSALASSVTLTACVTNDGQQTRLEGGALGAAIGGAIGALTNKDDRGKGALIGGAVGGALGLAYGQHVAQRKADYARQEDYLQAVAQQAQESTQQAQAYNVQLASEIDALSAMEAQLRSQQLSSAQKNTLLAEKRARASASLRESQQMLASMRENVMIQTAVLEDERHSSSVSTMQVLSTNTHALEEEQLALERMQRQLQMIDRRRM